MEWDDIRVLLALLRANNLLDAGARIGVDRSTISRRLVAIERRVGKRLFVRTRDGVRPTPAAERLRPLAEKMEADAAALVKAIGDGEQRVSGTVRLATTETFSTLLLTGGLLDLRQRYPELVVEMLTGYRTVDLAGGEADLAVRSMALKHGSLRARCLARCPVGVFAAAAYLEGRGTPRSPGALSGHDVLLPVGELSRMPEARWLASRPGVRPAFCSNSIPALVTAASAGQGLVALPVACSVGHPLMQCLFLVEAVPPRPVWLVTPEGTAHRPAVRVVSEEVAAILKRLFGPRG